MGSVETNFLMNRDSVLTVWKLSYSYDGSTILWLLYQGKDVIRTARNAYIRLCGKAKSKDIVQKLK